MPCLPPAAVLAGLPLALRALLTLQQQGAERLLLVAAEPSLSALAADPRLTLALQKLAPDANGAVDWAALAAVVNEPFVLVRHDWPLGPRAYHALLNAELPSETLALLGQLNGRPNQALVGRPALLKALATGKVRWEPLTSADGAADAHLAPLDVGPSWGADASTAEGRAAAVSQLFEACRKPVDGIVSRHLNRSISLWISRRLVNTSITPNAMTAVTFAVGLGAAALATQGGYAFTLAAAAGMQLNSILDGCDGELARVRFLGSKLGQWLDTIGDDVSNVIFWTALGFGALKLPEVSWLAHAGHWLALCAWITALGNGLAAAQYYVLLWGLGSGDFYAISQADKPPPSGPLGMVVRLFTVVLKQDFFLLLVLLLAALDLLMWSLPVMAIGALITLGSASLRSWQARASRRSQSAHGDQRAHSK